MSGVYQARPSMSRVAGQDAAPTSSCSQRSLKAPHQEVTYAAPSKDPVGKTRMRALDLRIKVWAWDVVCYLAKRCTECR